MELLEYNSITETCYKCGVYFSEKHPIYIVHDAGYDPNSFWCRGLEIIPEHLRKRCGACGYVWYEKCRDVGGPPID